MKIAFYAGNCIPVKADSLEERPLGGTETGLIRLTEILQKRGHEVIVFTRMQSPPPSEPRYLFHGELLNHGPYDLLVLMQDWKPVFYGVPAKRIFFWTGDGFDIYSNFGLGDKRVVRKIDKFLAASRWHAETLCEKSGFPFDKSFVLGNGVHLPYFEGGEERSRKRLIYASAPYRGLELVPKIYAELKTRHPDMELHVFAGMSVYDTDRAYQGPEQELAGRLGEILRSIPGVHVHGNVTQKVLAREMMKSSVLLYPNTIFETCCIVAMEAQAGGCPVVASANSGLVETVGKNGFLIEGAPGSADYMKKCREAVGRLLSDDGLWSSLSKKCLARAKEEFGWEKVADRFESLL